jgi:SAM-dependent methyltransferase
MWYDVLKQIETLLGSESDDDLRQNWRAFVEMVSSVPEQPYHLRLILSELDSVRGGRERSQIAVFDHGCGPGSTLIWLAALGYINVFGVDVGHALVAQNRLARVCWGATDDHFIVYDGKGLPFRDGTFDLIISQQVLEHVPDDQFEAYYSEEARVLRPGGRALHQVPHRLIPYDSHTRTWFLHMLPRKMSVWMMALRHRQWPDHLHLRWPWVHMRMARKHIGPCTSLSQLRLMQLQQFDYYDGPVGVRRVLARLCGLPLIGSWFSSAAIWAVLLETRTIRGAGRIG